MLKPPGQLSLFPELTSREMSLRKSRSGTFVDNMKLPVHRWFRYSAGFSAEWVVHEIQSYCSVTGIKKPLILDPFAGSGTVLLAAESIRVDALGFEPHPFVNRIAKAKLAWNADIGELQQETEKLLKRAAIKTPRSARTDVPLLKKCFIPGTLRKLDAIRDIFLSDIEDGSPESKLIWLAITSILRACSPAGTAQWQYVLPNKRKTNVLEPFAALRSKINQMAEDIAFAKRYGWANTAEILVKDARNPGFDKKEIVDLVITSPPYPNNYDYADSTRLEMTFWGEVQSWADLHEKIRKHLICSCSQHSAREKLHLEKLLSNPLLDPIRKELEDACNRLAKVRLTKGGRKTYHTMAAAYFLDLAKVFHSLRPLCKEGSQLCFVVGDSAPYGVHLAVDKWLGELALSAGFHSFSFRKIRDRNVKWKNRKHRVSLHEGHLWIKG